MKIAQIAPLRACRRGFVLTSGAATGMRIHVPPEGFHRIRYYGLSPVANFSFTAAQQDHYFVA
jgi:hypothetical protein